MNRRGILIALARAGLLTPELSAHVRAADDGAVLARLAGLDPPDDVLAAADLPRFTLQPRHLDLVDIQQLVDLHLAMIDFAATPVEESPSSAHAEGLSYNRAWMQLLLADNPTPLHLPYDLPLRARLIVARSHRDAAWVPLRDLAAAGITPWGVTIPHAQHPTPTRFLFTRNAP